MLANLGDGLLLAGGFVLATKRFGARWQTFVGAAALPELMWFSFDPVLTLGTVMSIALRAAARGGSVYLAIAAYHRFAPTQRIENAATTPA